MNINGKSRPEIEFAPQENINAHEALAQDFLLRVFDIDGAWISDESSLWDFHFDESEAEILKRIDEIYGVDVSDIESGNLSQILDRIATTR